MGGTSGGFTLNIFDHPDSLRTITWQTGIGTDPGTSMLSVAPHVTLSMRDGLTPVFVPLPAALPLFAAGLGLLGWLGWRRRTI